MAKFHVFVDSIEQYIMPVDAEDETEAKLKAEQNMYRLDRIGVVCGHVNRVVDAEKQED